jgi:hypothetical protein
MPSIDQHQLKATSASTSQTGFQYWPVASITKTFLTGHDSSVAASKPRNTRSRLLEFPDISSRSPAGATAPDRPASTDAIVVIEHHAQQHRVVVGEEPAQRLGQLGGLFRCLALGQRASERGSRSPAISACIMARPDTPWMSDSTEPILTCASSRSFSIRWRSRVRSPTRARR